MRNFLWFILALLSSASLLAQTDFSSGRAALIGANLTYQLPSGNWTDQFGPQFGVGPEFGWKFSSNWIISGEGMYCFGNQVNNSERVIAPVVTSSGNVINLNGNYATVTVYQRSAYTSFSVSKILPFWQANSNSGPIIGIGGGYLWHWIRVDNAGNDSPQINEEYEKGYDQLSHGLMTTQSIGYLFLSKNRRVNFKLSFEFMQGFTQNVRKYNYATGQVPQNTNTNLLYGVKLSWYIPIFLGGKTQEYYYD